MFAVLLYLAWLSTAAACPRDHPPPPAIALPQCLAHPHVSHRLAHPHISQRLAHPHISQRGCCCHRCIDMIIRGCASHRSLSLQCVGVMQNQKRYRYLHTRHPPGPEQLLQGWESLPARVRQRMRFPILEVQLDRHHAEYRWNVLWSIFRNAVIIDTFDHEVREAFARFEKSSIGRLPTVYSMDGTCLSDGSKYSNMDARRWEPLLRTASTAEIDRQLNGVCPLHDRKLRCVSRYLHTFA